MNAHRNARTTPYSRALIVERSAAGEAAASIAASFGVSVRTVYKWIRRYREGGCLALENGSSAPARPARCRTIRTARNCASRRSCASSAASARRRARRR